MAARVESGVPEIRPRSVAEVLDVAMEVFRARFGVYVGLSTLLWFPVYFVRPILAPDDWLTARGEGPGVGALLGFVVTLLATLGVSVLDNAIVARLVAAELAGETLSVLAAIRGVLARSFAIVVIAGVNALATATGFLCLCVPGFLVAWKLYLAPAVCVIEEAGIFESLARSAHLSRRRFGPWLGLFIAGMLLLLPFSSMAGVADQPGVRDSVLQRLGIPALAYDWARIGFSSLFTGVAYAFQGVMVTVWYFDCVARRDGADLVKRLERLRSASVRELGGAQGAA